MNRLLRATALALPVLVAIVAACSSDEDASSSDAFSISLTIAGQGQVTSTPAGIDCAGPKDCGTSSYAASTAVVLTTTPATGYVLSKIEVNGLATTDSRIQGDAGSKALVTVTFAVRPGTPDPAGTDAGDAGPGCTTADACGTAQVCCIRARSTADGFVPTGSSCETPDACRANDDQGQAGYPMCTPPTDTRCLPVEACIAAEQGSSTYICVLPTL